MNLIQTLEWRYATKQFDPTKKVSPDDLEKIKKAIQLSASSYGLQLYKVLIIEDQELRERLKPASWGQDQITDASHLIVFCNYAEVNDRDVDEFLELKVETQQLDMQEVEGYGDFMKDKIDEKSAVEQAHWTARQTYLALGNLLAACAELKIDACPMEGFEPDRYNKILGLEEQGLNASVIAAIGYRTEDDERQFAEKVRKPKHQLFEKI
ncbi:NAD(P)H-dependent oxidoreductase [Aliifodinibius sp. S!AR15-10]|uniref:NAD(P)H-dependent oxidoreductase n=1 Tax=Aliifodinibius sp. S!AR15-10 TaxID=2950437 RepID=UPI0028607371|nr:NAD(P)H-dependent oxidoreductase [Aliifodinibius sp. S!AR15-10]MDR8391398.1 NAD(P)H-dependent oxidoreductase [Aliifodinibius sp. S!AR15-10]